MRDVNVPKKEIDDLLEELIGAWDWDALANSEANHVDGPASTTKKRRSDVSYEPLQTPPFPSPAIETINTYQVETVSIPLAKTVNDSLTKPLTVDTQLAPVESSLIISNQLLTKPSEPHVKQSSNDDTLLVAQLCSCEPEHHKQRKQHLPVRRYVYGEYVEKYKHLRELQPYNESFGEVTVGFTKKQIAVLEHQMRVYTQFSIQHFLQMFSHPKFWDQADQFKTDLKELQAAVKSSSLNVCNLDKAVEFVKRWETDLSEVNQENKKHIQFIEEQMSKVKYGARNILRFPPKVMQAILTEEAFLYPEFVPKVAFRTDETTFKEFSPSELM